MAKKKQNIFIEYNLWLVLAVVIALGFIILVVKYELKYEYNQLVGFNPETECEKCIINWEEPKCSEECICDEYNDNIIGSWKQCFDGTCMEGDVILINDSTTHQGTKIMINHHSNCIQAHEKNECEKGNSGWIEETKCIISQRYGINCRNMTTQVCYDCGLNAIGKCDDLRTETFTRCDRAWRCELNETTCRKKTLRDLDCDELKEELLNEGKDYCPRYHILFFCGGGWRDNRYGTDKELLVDYINRCA